MTLQNLHQNPILVVKEHDCKIQTGVIKIIHPIDLIGLENTMNMLISVNYNKLTENNSLAEIAKFKIRKLYTNFYQVVPRHHRSRRWNTLGTAWKWIAGSPDAQDLRIINSTMNDLIEQNNNQIQINNQINQRMQKLTNAINSITERVNSNRVLLNEIETITTILNTDVINNVLEQIQDAIIWSKVSITNNKILTINEITMIKSMLQEQGIITELPDEALEFVVPKIAVNKDTMLYILQIPQLENSTSIIARIYPLVVNQSIIINYPEYIIKSNSKIFTTLKPEDFVQKSSDIKEFGDECISKLINGNSAECNSTHENGTMQSLIAENSILISNSKNHTIKSNCGPDDRNLKGNFLITFSKCSVQFNGVTFKSDELVTETKLVHGALHNLKISWNYETPRDLRKIDVETTENRRKLDHIHLEQFNTNLKIWTLFGSSSMLTIVSIIVICFIFSVVPPNGSHHPKRDFRNFRRG